MKILVDAHCFDYNTSEGINTYIKGLYSEVIKIAEEIDFYFVANNINRLADIFGEHHNVHYVKLTAHNKIQRLFIEIPSLISKYKIDIAHFQYTAPLIKNCKTIVTLHDILFKDYPDMFPWKYRLSKDILFKISAKRADLLLTVSEYSKDRIIHYYKIPSDKLSITPNAVSEDFFNINSVNAKSFVKNQGIDNYILYVSRIEPRKNQIAVLKAYIELNLFTKGYDLVFIGRKTLPVPDFDKYIEQLPTHIRAKIHIYNQVPYPNLKLWYKAASLFIYPALAEGFGIPPIEAGAAGIPCICSNRTAMRDFSFFGHNLIDPDDEKQMKNSILENLKMTNSESLKKISNQIHSKYNWETIAKNFYSEIKKDFNTHMIKVAVIGTQGVPASYGGFESLVENLLGDNCSEDIRYTVFCSRKDLKTDFKEYKGAELKYVGLHANGMQSIPYDILSMVRAIKGYDVILVLGVSGCLFLPVFRLLCHKRLIINIDGLEHKRDKWGKAARWILRSSEAMAVRYADTVISDNKGIQDYVTETYGKDSVLIAYGGDHVLRNVSTDRQDEILKRYNLKDRDFAMTVCRIEPENNCHITLEAFSRSDRNLVFIGNWDRSEYGRNLKEKYGKCNNITILDPIYDLDTLYALRSHCSLYVHGHSAGGTNPSLVEAMFFGKPIICYDVVYNRATTFGQAFYFKDAESLHEVIRETTLQKMAECGDEMKRLAETHYTWEKIASQYESLFR